MKLQEHRAKRLLESYGIRVPKGYVIRSEGEILRVTEPVVLKAQVLSGGRGKAGGIRTASSLAEARLAAKDIFSLTIAGYRPKEILVESRVDIAREIYLSIVVDRSAGIPLLLLSSEGGVEIETVTEEKIGRWHIHPFLGIKDFMVREMIGRLGLDGGSKGEFDRLVRALWLLFYETDCELAEINPLVLTKEGEIIAADAKMTVNDDALWRHPELRDAEEELTPLEKEAREKDIAFVQLDGEIGVIANGAGLTMATLDNLSLHGGRGGVFLDLGGTDDPKKVEDALELMLKASPKVILLNIFGGMTRCDSVASGVLAVK
ncbi:MAG: ADP-forming succinate--CoA ligase subunit beta, partial [Euryarchaeota archaeon]|nr:ADP-forming succinate--CoA ligase subunit beta [Euryarchaeota archaeon]